MQLLSFPLPCSLRTIPLSVPVLPRQFFTFYASTHESNLVEHTKFYTKIENEFGESVDFFNHSRSRLKSRKQESSQRYWCEFLASSRWRWCCISMASCLGFDRAGHLLLLSRAEQPSRVHGIVGQTVSFEMGNKLNHPRLRYA